MKKEYLIYTLIASALLTGLLTGCKKDKNDNAVKDIDGNVYQTITIGNKVWMVENLRVTHYRNGDSIPNISDGTVWSNLVTGAVYSYPVAGDNPVYGKLYNWYAVNDTRNIAPKGWHVSSDAEWATLIDSLGGVAVAGGKLKEKGFAHWQSPNTAASNEIGFTALPGGGKNEILHDFGLYGYWWTSYENDAIHALARELGYDNSTAMVVSFYKQYGLSIRCVKD